MEKFILFTLAKQGSQKFLFKTAKAGDPVSLRLSNNGNWTVRVNNNYIGVLSTDNLNSRNELQHVDQGNLSGFYITSFIQYTLEESLKYDEDHDKKYTNNWDDYCRNQGWIIIPDFSGYGK